MNTFGKLAILMIICMVKDIAAFKVKTVYAAMLKSGQPKSGVELGAVELCKAVKSVSNTPIECKYIIESSESISRQEKVGQFTKELYSTLLKDRNFHFVVGGDHSLTIGSIAASAKRHPNLHVIYIDAHADINSMEGSTTKNIHGMPLAFMTGINSKLNREYKGFEWLENRYLNFTNLFEVGLRDVDKLEKISLIQHEIRNWSSDDIRCKGANIILREIRKVIRPDVPVHISLDVDVMDPKHMKCTGLSPDKGLHPDDVIDLIWAFRKQMVAFDINEYNPKICTEKERSMAHRNIMRIIDAIMF